MLFAADFRQRAREGLAGNWGKAVGTGLVAALLGASTLDASLDLNYDLEDSDIGFVQDFMENAQKSEVLWFVIGLIGILAVISIALFAVRLIIGSPVTLGYAKFNLKLVNRDPAARFSDLFTQFHMTLKAIGMQVQRAIFVILWTLLFIIPGLVKTYSYAMTPYILYENPQLTANQAITESRRLMDGNKWRLFCLEMSFIGWAFLSLFTFGIGVLWLRPYMEAAYAAFYQEIKWEKYRIPYGETREN